MIPVVAYYVRELRVTCPCCQLLITWPLDGEAGVPSVGESVGCTHCGETLVITQESVA